MKRRQQLRARRRRQPITDAPWWSTSFSLAADMLCFVAFIWTTASSVEVGNAAAGNTYASKADVVCDKASRNAGSRPPRTTCIVDKEQLGRYRQDGFVLMRGVLDEALVEKMARAGRAIADRAARYPQYFSVVENGPIFDGGAATPTSSSPPSATNGDERRYQHHPDPLDGMDAAAVFRQAAIYSTIPQIAAELMELDPERQNLRVLRDIFLAKSINETGCDWHVDDHGFWPESYLSEASKQSGKDQDGVNVWIALVDMPAIYQGSMALSAGSHREPWRFEAFEAIGQNRTSDGGHTKESIVARLEEKRRTGTASLGACEIEKARPDLRAKMEARKVVVDIERGDIIFSTRSLWHKTMDVTEEGKRHYESLGLDHLNRYSIRYTAGSARLPKGWLAEWSAVSDPENPGSSLNDIVNKESGVVWYPQVWPTLDKDMDLQLNLVADTQLDHAKQKVKADIVELFMPKAPAIASHANHQPAIATRATAVEQS